MGSRAVSQYPRKILEEFETLRKLNQGFSLARYGDGELKLIFGASYSREAGSLKLATELFNTLNFPCPQLLVGIPTLNPRGPKYASWLRHVERFERVIHGEFQYYSAFVTRPDSAPWIEHDKYLQLCLNLWSGKRAMLLSEPTNKLLKLMRATSDLTYHEVPSRDCYRHIDELEATVLDALPEIAVLSIGPTATCLAGRLAARGVQAIDFGSIGGMLARLAERRSEAAGE